MTGGFIHQVIVAMFIAGGTLLHAQNLVTNGGFENGLTGWSNNTSGGASASFSVVRRETPIRFEARGLPDGLKLDAYNGLITNMTLTMITRKNP